jgi:hypothetical protein
MFVIGRIVLMWKVPFKVNKHGSKRLNPNFVAPFVTLHRKRGHPPQEQRRQQRTFHPMPQRLLRTMKVVTQFLTNGGPVP